MKGRLQYHRNTSGERGSSLMQKEDLTIFFTESSYNRTFPDEQDIVWIATTLSYCTTVRIAWQPSSWLHLRLRLHQVESKGGGTAGRL